MGRLYHFVCCWVKEKRRESIYQPKMRNLTLVCLVILLVGVIHAKKHNKRGAIHGSGLRRAEDTNEIVSRSHHHHKNDASSDAKKSKKSHHPQHHGSGLRNA